MHGSRKRNPTIQTTVRVPIKTKEELILQMVEDIKGKTAWVRKELAYLRQNLNRTTDTKKHVQSIAYLEIFLREIPDDVYNDYQILYGTDMFPDIKDDA